MLETKQVMAEKNVKDKIRCNKQAFGHDPIEGVRKQCFCEQKKPLRVDIKISDMCAEEGGKNDMCTCTGKVFYGTWDSIESSDN